MIPYREPEAWVRYDVAAILPQLIEARVAIDTLRAMPFQRTWAEALQSIELKREVAGTSRIEGAEFTEPELDRAMTAPVHELVTRSQRQARAAVEAYSWIARLPSDRAIDSRVIREIHERIVRGADDDVCPPGELRSADQNVTFGRPRHRGVEGGEECRRVFDRFCASLTREFRAQDPLIRALAAHYHLAAMHPFLDGNGRTARALEALLLQRAGLRDACFVAMSNYYYEEKAAYLATLSETGARSHDLTPFLAFGLTGIARQARRLLAEIQTHISRVLFRDTMLRLFGKLESPRKRVIGERQILILELLLQRGRTRIDDLHALARSEPYAKLKNPEKALVRDLDQLVALGAVRAETSQSRLSFEVRHEWPEEITERRFIESLASTRRSSASGTRS